MVCPGILVRQAGGYVCETLQTKNRLHKPGVRVEIAVMVRGRRPGLARANWVARRRIFAEKALITSHTRVRTVLRLEENILASPDRSTCFVPSHPSLPPGTWKGRVSEAQWHQGSCSMAHIDKLARVT